ncbi:HAD family hydrolase, partial [Bacillus sp. S34]|nr:HAD family hydrolase [Bacillus sp. S34]
MTVIRAVLFDLDGVIRHFHPEHVAAIEREHALTLGAIEAFAFVDRAAQLKSAFDAHGITAKTGHAFLVEETIPL